VTAIAEHHIEDDDQAPTVAEHLNRQVDRATRSLCAVWVQGFTRGSKHLPYANSFTIVRLLAVHKQLGIQKSSCPSFAFTASRYRSMAIVPV
jgi:hypothetical protein